MNPGRIARSGLGLGLPGSDWEPSFHDACQAVFLLGSLQHVPFGWMAEFEMQSRTERCDADIRQDHRQVLRSRCGHPPRHPHTPALNPEPKPLIEALPTAAGRKKALKKKKNPDRGLTEPYKPS